MGVAQPCGRSLADNSADCNLYMTFTQWVKKSEIRPPELPLGQGYVIPQRGRVSMIGGVGAVWSSPRAMQISENIFRCPICWPNGLQTHEILFAGITTWSISCIQTTLDFDNFPNIRLILIIFASLENSSKSHTYWETYNELIQMDPSNR